MKAWAVFLDDQTYSSFLVFEDNYEDAISRARRVCRGPYSTMRVVHDPERDWVARFHKEDKFLWNDAFRACPSACCKDKNGAMETRSHLMAVMLKITGTDFVAMLHGNLPTTDAVRRKLRLMAGPHGRTLMIAKLRQLGFEVL